MTDELWDSGSPRPGLFSHFPRLLSAHVPHSGSAAFRVEAEAPRLEAADRDFTPPQWDAEWNSCKLLNAPKSFADFFFFF